MTIADTLREARRRIEEPEKWGKWSDRRFCFATHECAAQAIATLRRAIGTNFIGWWNDAPERTHAEVLAAFDRAIALAEKAEEKRDGRAEVDREANGQGLGIMPAFRP